MGQLLRADPMPRDFQVRTTAVLLAILTIAAASLAWLNFESEHRYSVPDDGVWWLESNGHLQARNVSASGPGEKAGIKRGDILLQVNAHEVNNSAALSRARFGSGIYREITYTLQRDGVKLDVQVITVPADRSLNAGLRLIALIYLGIGLYVLFRRWTAPKSLHFYLFCLVSFISYSFKYTGKLNSFDWTIYWCNIAAWLLQPALFLHFTLTFPEVKAWARHRWAVISIYVPAALLMAVQITAISRLQATELLRFNLDRLQMFYLVVYFWIAAAVLYHTYRNSESPLQRQQMRWITRGTVLALAPFTLFYVFPYLLGIVPTAAMQFSFLSLIFLPLTFGYAIVRFRLMDVDLIFKRGMTYTLAMACIAGLYFGGIGIAAGLVHARMPSAGPWGLMAAIAITALLFDPVKRLIQARVDRIFYKTRYDYRHTLIEFGRDLNSETDLPAMLTAVIDRLSRTLLVNRAAIFVAASDGSGFALAKSFGIAPRHELDLSFLTGQAARRADDARHVFYDNPHRVVSATPADQQVISTLDLNYYIPCQVQNRTIAVLGLGKSASGEFLSSEDIELLETLSSYIGIAIQNAQLYASLAQKALQYERLKDFNENIVESISVGVLAVDLEDRIESWNSQMEVMYATPRARALRRSLSELFSPAFLEEFYRVRNETGIHNLYKFHLATFAGDTRVTNIAIAPLMTREFKIVGRLIIVDDITERIDLESQLAQAEKMSSIGLLAAGVAHEVNTPLAVISSYTQMLQKHVSQHPSRDDDRIAPLLDKITRQTFRASEIVNSLLNFSRTSGTAFGEVDLNKVLLDTLNMLEHQMKMSQIRVQPNFYPDLPLIYGNAGKLQQVFLNLFLNARDAMPGGGTLTIHTVNGNNVGVEINDTGSGIAKEHLPRIYDPFFTTKTNPKEGQRRGTGLGLAVSFGIIQEHAGKIRVDSQPGHGTTFHLEFPVLRPVKTHV
ncbi:MAG: ATP-binding protein [Acidobacteriaceae bacterium]